MDETNTTGPGANTTTWISVASRVAQVFRESVAARDARGGTPTEEMGVLREAGLLPLLVPAAYGGAGGNWELGYKVIREIAKADGSLAHLLGYHYHFAELLRFFGTEEQRARNLRESVQQGWVWGGAVNPRDPDVLLRVQDDHFVLNGRKTFCTGARVADRLIVGVKHEGATVGAFVSIPARRAGVIIRDDWAVIGQRQAESGSVVFENVIVYKDELVGSDSPLEGPQPAFSSLTTPTIQLIFVNLYLGIALGAFDAAREYTRTTTRPWLTAGVDAARHDPYILEQYGSFWSDLAAATALTDQVGTAVQAAYDRGDALTARERGEVAVAVATAKVVTTRVGLQVTSAIFDVMGARSTASGYAFDRFWRNIRTHSLHDPLAYKIREVGDFVLNDTVPEPTAYS